MNRFAAALVMIFLLSAPALAAKPKAGDAIADVEVKAKLKPAEAAYLGLAEGAQSFRLSQIKAEALLVHIYSMYCPRCQAEALAVNRVFERLAGSPQGQKFKFASIAAGNSPFEVEVFRKKFQSPMPLIADPDYALHKAFMAVGTPSYFVLKRAPGGKGFTVLFALEGQFEDENAFFEQVLRAAALR